MAAAAATGSERTFASPAISAATLPVRGSLAGARVPARGGNGSGPLSPVDRSAANVAQTMVSSWEIVLFCAPVFGTALAAHKMNVIHQRYIHEIVPVASPEDQGVKSMLSADMGACLTACIVSTLFNTMLVAQYMALEALAVALGGLAVSAAIYIAASSSARTNTYALGWTRPNIPGASGR